MSWTSRSDVTDTWIGEDAPDPDDRLQVWIERAERKLRALIPDLQARVDAEADQDPPSTELADRARDVVVAMVTRKYVNPRGFRSITDTTGPFATQNTYGGDSPGDLSVTDEELRMLGGGTASGAFSIDTRASVSAVHSAVCSRRFGALYCSCGSEINRLEGPLWEMTS